MQLFSQKAIAALYLAWAVPAIGIALMAGGPTPENMTRVLVLAFLLAQIGFRDRLIKMIAFLPPRQRFIFSAVFLAAVVEGFHMISTPVFLDLRVTAQTVPSAAIEYFIIDLLFTIPAYLVIFPLIWAFASKYQYSLWQYVLIMGLGQVIGDGGLFFFLNAPPMLIFLPYPMSNYHAVNVLPFLAVRSDLPPGRIKNRFRQALAVPALIGVYLLCGTAIKVAGSLFGLK